MATAADPTRGFFEHLAETGADPLLRPVTGTIRFDLTADGRTEHWRVALKAGVMTVGRGGDAADATVAMSRDLFDRLATGQANLMTAILRDEVQTAGNLGLIVRFQRVFPGAMSA
jgi:alkyl sulfatase BDS1-like metallo-beta-lactamase superfamily hydrolase